MRRDGAVVRVVMMNVEGMRGRGKPKNRWIDRVENDMRIAGVSE